jgi:hypothetical protein
MGMMIVARKLDEDAYRVRYTFGLDERFDRVLVIEKATWDIASVDGAVDSVAGKIAMKIKRAWEAEGEFPAGAIFAS